MQLCAAGAESGLAGTHAKEHSTQNMTVKTQAITTAQQKQMLQHRLLPSATAHTIELRRPLVKHGGDALSLSPLACGTSHLCCGPPPLLPSKEAQRATSVANFLEDDLPPMDEESPVMSSILSPEDKELPARCEHRTQVSSGLVYSSPLSQAMEAGAEAPSSPAVTVPVCLTACSTTTTTVLPPYRSHYCGTQLPNCAVYVGAENAFCYRPAEKRDLHGATHERGLSSSDFLTTHPESAAPLRAPHSPNLGSSLHCQHRYTWPHGSHNFDSSGSNVPLSAFTTPVTPIPAAAIRAATRSSEDNAAAMLPLRNGTSPRSLSENGTAATTTTAGGQQTGSALPRIISLETIATQSSSRSRPVPVSAATGLQVAGASTAGSTTASTTITSVTYTRKNVSLGALDFYGNPVTSLSTLLAQMSVRSGDRDELEQLDLRHHTQQHQQPHQHQQKNTLSMQNLKAHTQQVGEMGPEDKIKRLRVRPETAAPIASALRRYRASCPASCLTTSCATPATAAAAGSCATNTSTKSQVGCLKDVLQECNFLCINDVINAIAETQAHELQEAQQQLVGGACTAKTATVSAAETSTTTAVTCGESITGAATELGAPPLPSLQRTASPLTSAWSEEGGSPLTRGTGGPSFTTAAATSGLPASTDVIDAQHALNLAAAITEVSLNLERGCDVSSSASNLVATGASARRSHVLRTISGRSAACSMGAGTTRSVSSSSPPNLTNEVPVAVSHTSTVVSPVLQRPTTPYSFRVSPSPVGMTPPYTALLTAFTDDPLERKVWRCSSSDVVTEANQFSTSAYSEWSPTMVSQTIQSSEVVSPVLASTVKRAYYDPSGASETVAGERRAVGKTRGGGSRWLVLAGCYAPNWHGLVAANEESTTQAGSATPQQVGASTYSETSFTSPVKIMPPRKEGDDCLSKSFIGDARELGSGAVKMHVLSRTACALFDDELSTVRELRKWAKCVAQQEALQPSTNTEVTT
ncbi:hypothetical protein ABL78_5213 [Leptomonas seymouri]|uniref:Uncharacterized protein n=1 Tax=Leptomonas seymouri TaxID=5684 RepID=A0A0N0P4V1_LEPSE|nr:hypothetical protein ABL78_5213 [Leptomonas seymouri]|eukprot:KPI85726.1 hypothetical protein ABL78_5213 [Leptomonas seymouri]